MERYDPITGELMPFGRRVRRALSRRFPRLRRFYDYLRSLPARLLPRLRLGRLRATAAWLGQLGRTIARRRRETRLTVGVDVTPFWEPLTGVGWYLYRLLESLAERPDLRIRLYGPTVVASPDLEEPVEPLPRGPALERVLYGVPDDLLVSARLAIPALRWLEPLLLAADGNEVLFAPNYFLPPGFLFARGAKVATVHDLGMRMVPGTLQRETLDELAGKLEHSMFEAAQLISVSRAVRAELATFGYAHPARVTAIHHGPGQLASVEATGLPKGVPSRYGLHVGTLEPRKNVLVLIEAWRRLRRRLDEPPPLVLCGRFGWKTDAIRAAVDEAADEGWLLHLGYVAEGELASLYQNAAVVVFPSLYEGFGLPALEAQAAGAPLVCSDLPVLREVAGEAALFAVPDRPGELADRLVDVLGEGGVRDRLAEAGRQRTRNFSWQRTADRTAEVWRRAAGRPAAATVAGSG